MDNDIELHAKKAEKIANQNATNVENILKRYWLKSLSTPSIYFKCARDEKA